MTDKHWREIVSPGEGRVTFYEYAYHVSVISLRVMDWARGKGVGTRLMRDLQAKGKRIYLYPVSEDWRQSDLERFYSRLGFVTDSADPDLLVWRPTIPHHTKRPAVEQLPNFVKS